MEPAKLTKIAARSGRREADLPNALDVRNDNQATEKKDTDTKETADKPTATKDQQDDYQLARAVDLLRGITLYKTLKIDK